MANSILNLTDAPEDPIERLVWLAGVDQKVRAEMDDEWAEAYYWCRFTGRLDAAVKIGQHSKRRILAFTRQANEKLGRTVRWGDGQ